MHPLTRERLKERIRERKVKSDDKAKEVPRNEVEETSQDGDEESTGHEAAQEDVLA